MQIACGRNGDFPRRSLMMSPEASRDLRLDLWRGLALLIIYSDHIPTNVVAQYTPVAIGFSDMAEVFVFLSGYACGLSYGRRFHQHGFLSCMQRAEKRAVQVFAAKLTVTAIALGLIIILEPWVTGRFFSVPWSIDLVKQYPLQTALNIETFRLELYPFCVLALYVPLLAALPFVLWSLSRSPWLTILASTLLYLATQFFPKTVALPQPWRDALIFNPFAWQFLFFCGTAFGFLIPEQCTRWRPHWSVTLAAATLLILAIFLHDKYRTTGTPWTSKPNLEWLRLVHFAGVMTVACRFTPPSATLVRWVVLHPIMTCGRYSLVGYCAAGLFGILGEAAYGAYSDAWQVQVLVNLVGWTACLAVTALWSQVTRQFHRL
jgi:hypothetical protein